MHCIIQYQESFHLINWLTPKALLMTKHLPVQKNRHYQSRLLTGILLFLLSFSILTLLILLFFNPQHAPRLKQYATVIIGLVIFLICLYSLNHAGYYRISAHFVVAIAAVTPWTALIVDPAVLKGDFVPLVYVTFSVMLSSILLPTYSTIVLAICQFVGVSMVFLFSPATVWFNWFSFLVFVFLTSIFSILSNSMIQSNIRQIDDQTRQLELSEARLHDLSIRDHLTSLFNRRYLEEMLSHELQRAAQKELSLAVILIDVDHFKQINDTLGHSAGDVVLQKVGYFVLEQVRQSDFVCRYGGDEFVIILPDIGMEKGVERAEHLRKGIKQLFSEHADQLSGEVTISLGIAFFPDHGSTVQTMLQSADKALYQAKHEGRDRVVVAR